MPLLNGTHRVGDSSLHQQLPLKQARSGNAGNTSFGVGHLQTSERQNDYVTAVKEQTSALTDDPADCSTLDLLPFRILSSLSNHTV